MGKAVPGYIKMKSRDLLELMPEKFSKDFRANKESIKTLQLPFSKVIQNHMAAYIARRIEQSEKRS